MFSKGYNCVRIVKSFRTSPLLNLRSRKPHHERTDYWLLTDFVRKMKTSFVSFPDNVSPWHSLWKHSSTSKFSKWSPKEVKCGFTDPTQATARRLKNQNYTLKERSKYCLYPRLSKRGGGKRREDESYFVWKAKRRVWMQVKVKNSRELKQYVSQNIRTIRSIS